MNFWQKIQNQLSIWIGKISWTIDIDDTITDADRYILREKLAKDYYVILTRHDGHLSTYIISWLHFFMTGKFGYYSHALMNLEDKVSSDADFRFVEATGEGVHYSTFEEIFDQQCGSVAILKPKGMTIDDWTAAMDRIKTDIGKPYDTLFDITQRDKLSCVELVRDALQGDSNYATNFARFESSIRNNNNKLDPQMFYDCNDFQVVWETRH